MNRANDGTGALDDGPVSLGSTLVFGSGAECPTERFCLPGLREVYGLTFREFRALDPGGPRTASALLDGVIDVGVLFTTDSRLMMGDLVVLEDDRHLQPAENVTPVLSLAGAHDNERLAEVLDAASGFLTTDELARLNCQVDVERAPRAEVTSAWVQRHGLGSAASSAAGADPLAATRAAAISTAAGAPVIVGAANFSESETVAELYAQALAANGLPVARPGAVGNRDTYFPELVRGTVHVVPEYRGSLLAFLQVGGPETSDSNDTHEQLQAALATHGLTALRPAPAQSQNGIAVTAGTAAHHRLEKVSDLARPI